MNKLEVGMYVRTKAGLIFKIEKYLNRENNIQLFYKECKVKTIKNIDEIKTSYNIIDLIEVGDYVNGSKLSSIDYAEDRDGNCDKLHFYYSFEDSDNDVNEYYEKLDIKTIVTKEQFSNIEYRLGE